MARFLILCLIMLHALLMVAKASDNLAPSANPTPPASSPSPKNVIVKQDISEAPQVRKLEKDRNKAIRSSPAPHLSPSEAPQNQREESHYQEAISSLDHETETAHLQHIHITKQHHRSVDKVVAGGVITGVLATAFLFAVFCYIRATRRKNAGFGPITDLPKV